MRAKVRPHQITHPLNDSMENYQDVSEKISLTIAAEFYNKPEASYALELAILKAMLSLKALAWDRTCLRLSDALDDLAIQRNPLTVDFLRKALNLTIDSEPY